MSKQKYDFRDTTDFLNESVPLSDLYNDVMDAMHHLSNPRLTKKKRAQIWHTLLTCADFIDTITVK